MLNDVEQYAKEYLDRTETYDRSISVGEIIDDEIRLEGIGVRRSSMAFAGNVRREICHKVSGWYSWKEIHSAIQNLHKWYKFEPWTEVRKTVPNQTAQGEDSRN